MKVCRREVLVPGEFLPDQHKAPGKHHVSSNQNFTTSVLWTLLSRLRCSRTSFSCFCSGHTLPASAIAAASSWHASVLVEEGRKPAYWSSRYRLQGTITRIIQAEGGGALAVVKLTDIKVQWTGSQQAHGLELKRPIPTCGAACKHDTNRVQVCWCEGKEQESGGPGGSREDCALPAAQER